MRLSQIDELTRADHSYLSDDDVCYFVGEYTAREGFAYSATNNLILNLKKSMSRRGSPDWRYKIHAIREAATDLRKSIPSDVLSKWTFVPIPPSKAKGDPLYDDRLTQVLNSVVSMPRLDVRELIEQSLSTVAAHNSPVRPKPATIENIYRIDESLLEPTPQTLAIVDDLITTGAHYIAAKRTLAHRFPGVPAVGLFLARRVPDTSLSW